MTTLMIEIDNHLKQKLEALAQKLGKTIPEMISDLVERETDHAGLQTLRMSPEYRKKLLQVGVWTDEQIRRIEEAQSNWNFEAFEW